MPATFLSEEPAPLVRSLDWKREISQLVESHKARRSEPSHPATGQHPVRLGQTSAHDRAARIAASVAARYAATPTYTELLQRRNTAAAEALTEATKQPAADSSALAEETLSRIAAEDGFSASPLLPAAASLKDETETTLRQNAGRFDLTPEIPFEAAPEPAITGTFVLPDLRARSVEMNVHAPEMEAEPALEDLLAASVVMPAVPLPANLIEFPRELIATKKVRPQLVEGPLGPSRPDAAEPAQAQLRIFEVEPGIEAETAPTPAPASTPIMDVSEPAAHQNRASTWSSICLDVQPRQAEQTQSDTYDVLSVPLQSASIDRRLMAFAVDFCAVTGAFLAFLFVFALSTPHLPTGTPAVIMSGVVYLALWVLYQFLFFSLGDATVGMHYARIALCTFEDENPSRTALRRRIAAWWISALPLGLGFAWALLDEDNLSWHDRMTRTYQRSY
jgi:uncharacterized RDD family membrane protein YckC